MVARRVLWTRAAIKLAFEVAADPMRFSPLACEGAAAVIDDLGHHRTATALRLAADPLMPRRARKVMPDLTPEQAADCYGRPSGGTLATPAQLDLFSPPSGAGACAPGASPAHRRRDHG